MFTMAYFCYVTYTYTEHALLLGVGVQEARLPDGEP